MTCITTFFDKSGAKLMIPTLLYIGLTVVYLGGAWVFWKGFKRTNFSGGLGTRIGFAILWPVLFVANSSFRRNFQKTLRGGD
jgi:hypothetical protein